MATRRIGIVMHGVTGRNGDEPASHPGQFLAIRDPGGRADRAPATG